MKTTWIVVNEPIDESRQLKKAENTKNLGGTIKGSVQSKYDPRFLLRLCLLSCRINMDRNTYVPGETALTKVKVNNTSVKPIKFVRLSVTKHLDLQVMISFAELLLLIVYLFRPKEQRSICSSKSSHKSFLALLRISMA